MDYHISRLELKKRAYNALRRNGYHTIGEVQELVKGDPNCDRLLGLYKLGKSSQLEIKLALKKWSDRNVAAP